MYKSRSFLNFLVIAIMLLITAFSALFVYSSIYLKNRFEVKIVRKTDMVSEIITAAAFDLLSMGHNGRNYSLLKDYSHIIGVDEVGIFRTTGEEAFDSEPTSGSPPGLRKIGADERDSFKKVIFTMNATGFFDKGKKSYSRYVPLLSDSRCMRCHPSGDGPMGVLKIKLNAATDFELLGYLQWLIRTLGVIAILPMAALVVAVAIIREKNRVYSDLQISASDLRKTYNELKGVRSYLQMILDNSRAIIVTTDTLGRVVEFNPEGERILGYTKEEIAGKNVSILFEDQRHDLDILKEWVSGGGKAGAIRNREVVLRSRKGKLIYVSLTLSTMIDKEGEVIGTVGIGKDISEQKMLHFKLIQSEKLAGIGTLASGIAHEINNPLAGVLGMAEAIRDEDDVDLMRSHADDIIRYASSAGEIVRELSAYSRSAVNDAASTVDISAIIESSLKMARHSVSFTPVKVVKKLNEGCFVLANQGEIQQVFVNLIINAVHAMGESGTLTLKCRREDGFINTVVSDTGHGIPEEYLSHIYDPFFTTKPVGVGTGLGLYVVYRIVTKHNGTIDVETRKGRGTAFTLRFPAGESMETITLEEG